MTNINKQLKDIGKIVKKERKAKIGNINKAFLETRISPNTIRAIEEGKNYRLATLLQILEKIDYELIIREKENGKD